ncbi:MAG TPA: hypothetical protein VFC74_04005 [Oscillospiraceae bacterium]|nr:hypothetical protein [Oscillospiraceae bacterium]
MQVPKLKIGDKEYRAGTLKMKAWRNIVKVQKDIGKIDQVKAMQDEDLMFKMAKTLEVMFNNPDVTAELILEEMDVMDFVPAVQKVSEWVTMQVVGKLGEFPKNSPMTGRS